MIFRGTDGNPKAVSADQPLPVASHQPDALSFAALATVAVPSLAPASLIAASTSRKALDISNCSDETMYFAWSSGTGLTTSAYAFSIASGETLRLTHDPRVQLALFGICATGGKVLGYQSAT